MSYALPVSGLWVEEGAKVHEPMAVALQVAAEPTFPGDWVGEQQPAAYPPELAWQERSLCAQTDPEAFFPEKGGSTREAKRVCLSCDVRIECLEYALANDERFGIWGGLSERERRRVKKQAV
jgi:WhiB family transcriptional regulator, redox-sensing transcriptional regulator